MNILVYNWRDPKNPLAGGAEEYVYQIFSRLTKFGHKVTLFTSRFPDSLEQEEYGDITLIRKGGRISLYLFSVLFYLKHKSKYDLVVESINTIPFFTPLFVRKPRISIFHHIGGLETYSLEVGPFTSVALTAVQKITLLLYRREKVIAISESTQRELLSNGMLDSNISIIYNGVTEPNAAGHERFKEPTIIYFGRIRRLKRVEELLYIFSLVQSKVQNARLIIAGRGESEYLDWLSSLCVQLRLRNVDFTGEVNSEKKSFLLSKSWVYAITSVKEGWGISVLEANTSGLPVVAYDVPGLTDSVKNHISGFLIPNGDRAAFARMLTGILLNESLREELSVTSKKWARCFTWDFSSSKMNNLLLAVVG